MEFDFVVRIGKRNDEQMQRSCFTKHGVWLACSAFFSSPSPTSIFLVGFEHCVVEQLA